MVIIPHQAEQFHVRKPFAYQKMHLSQNRTKFALYAVPIFPEPPAGIHSDLDKIFTGPEITSLATYRTLSVRASMVHFTKVISPRCTSMQVIQRG